MSWKARRFNSKLDNEEVSRLAALPTKRSKHHVPPQHPDPQPKFIKVVDDRHHRAYHVLFKAAGSFEEACEILLRDWWTPPSQKYN
jgi:hypothetical protein